jgi:hypothetical protein
MNTSGKSLTNGHARADKVRVGQPSAFVPPPLATKSGDHPAFVAAPPLTDNKSARNSYTRLQAVLPPILGSVP